MAKEINKTFTSAGKEFDLAWQEFFKDKPRPKNDEEERKEQEEFHNWYNHLRKQSDTGKTPAEMYAETYGRKPSKNPIEISRMMNFEWDEDYDEELIGLIEELKEYDNEQGYKLECGEVREKLEPVIKGLIVKKEKALDWLHELLEYEETWSSLFALEILKEIKSPKSIPFLIKFIIDTEKGEYGDCCEGAMKALRNIREPAIDPLIKEIKSQFEKKEFYTYLVGSLTEIKGEKVYDFIIQVVEDYIKNEEKYDEWFHIDQFIHDLDKQEKKEVLPLLKKLLNLSRLSNHEKREVKSTIEIIKDPERYKKEIKEESKKLNPILNELMKEMDDNVEKEIDKKDIGKRMSTPDDNLEIQFKCSDCNKKQNIKPGLIHQMGEKQTMFKFENEIMCKFCFSNNLKLTADGKRDILFQAIGTLVGIGQGVMPVDDKVYVEDKEILFKESYNYILERIKQNPKKGELHLRAGNVAKNFNKYNEAIKHYEKSIELNPKLIASYMNLVAVYEYRYFYYKIKDAKVSASFYLNEMADLFRTQDFDNVTIRNKETIISFMGEKSESLGVHIPELVGIPRVPHKRNKIGRNEPCPCGSGKKYKKCCLN